MKKIYILLLAAFLMLSPNLIKAQSDIVITEIMYNPPEAGTDSLEFIEIYNNGSSTIDLSGWGFTSGVTFNFPPGASIAPGAYIVTAVDSLAMFNALGYSGAYEWNGGGLSNAGEPVALRSNLGVAKDSVRYDDNNPWPGIGSSQGGTDGGGASLVFCNPSLDNLNPINWSASDISDATGVIINTKEVYASPGSSGATCAAPCTVTNSSFSVTECISYIVPSGDETYTTPGTSTVADTISNSCGSDSIMAITVTILPVLTGNDNSTICATGSVVINGSTYDATTSTGTEIFTVGPNNCDSTVTIALNVLATIDLSIINTSPTLTANQSGATYQWLDCDNGNAVILNETGISFTATTNGNYAVEITLGSCIDTSACENIATVGISEIENKSISIYPNPTKGIIKIDFSNIEGSVNYTLTSVEGRVIKQERNISETLLSIDLSDQSKGIYLLKVENKYSAKIYRIVKE
tara:strand:+ start:555 stop:1952 length:1398 start_codon:yes stop_codon:yes gene_type:complete